MSLPERLFADNRSTCCKIFPSVSKFFSHLRIHSNEMPFVCPIASCRYSFHQKGNLQQHMDRVHPDYPNLNKQSFQAQYSDNRLVRHFSKEPTEGSVKPGHLSLGTLGVPTNENQTECHFRCEIIKEDLQDQVYKQIGLNKSIQEDQEIEVFGKRDSLVTKRE